MFTHTCLTILITGIKITHVMPLLTFKICPFLLRLKLRAVSCLFPAHCLHTVTDDNPELLRSVNATVLGVLENTLLSSQKSMAHTLLRSLAAGLSLVTSEIH